MKYKKGEAIDLTKMDREMLLEMDSWPSPPVWIREDYLAYSCWAEHEWQKVLYAKVDELKAELVKEGYEFNCDKITGFEGFRTKED